VFSDKERCDPISKSNYEYPHQNTSEIYKTQSLPFNWCFCCAPQSYSNIQKKLLIDLLRLLHRK